MVEWSFPYSFMCRIKWNHVYFLVSLFSLPLSPLYPLVVCVILMYVYKTGFRCFLNMSGPTHSSQPAEQGLDTLILGSFQSTAPFPSLFQISLGAEKYLNTKGGYLSQENVDCVEPSDLQGPISGLVFKWFQFSYYSCFRHILWDFGCASSHYIGSSYNLC